MRQWFVDPRIMCVHHLFGEHYELHMFCATLEKKVNVKGFMEHSLLDPRCLASRHEELVDEMKRRNFPGGFKHATPVRVPDFSYLDLTQVHTNRELSLQTLLSRCPHCMERYQKMRLTSGPMWEGYLGITADIPEGWEVYPQFTEKMRERTDAILFPAPTNELEGRDQTCVRLRYVVLRRQG